MKRKIAAVLLTLCTLLVLFPAPASVAAAAATYHPDDVAALNTIAAAHPELGWAQAPEDGTAVADGWDGSVWWNADAPKRVYKLVLNEKGLTGSLDVRGLTELEQLSCTFNELSSIDAGGLKELYNLNCAHNKLTSLNMSGSTALKYLYCDRNKLTGLDLSAFPKLYWVHCEYNELTFLNVTGLTNLSYFFCENNRLSSLDLSNLENLLYFYCYNNQLTSLNVNGCTALEGMECYNNLLGSLDVNGLEALDYLDCSHNLLTGTLDVRNTALSTLYCNNNRLSGLNLGGLTDLYKLDCYLNQLTSLDVSGLTSMEYLDCFSNKLTTLDVRELSELFHLDCEDNQLTSLHVRDLANLLFLYCSCNYLTELDVYGTSLRRLWVRSNCMTDESKVTGKTIDWDGDDFRYDTQYPQYIDVTFTATQTGGTSGTVDSTGIVLTFDQAVEDLPRDNIWVWGASGYADRAGLICSNENDFSDTWTIELGEVYTEEELHISILSFEEYRLPSEPQTTMVYKATGPVTYNITVHGGTADRETAILGTVVEITANPAGDGKRFTGWTVNSGGAVLDDETADVTTFQMPAHDVEVTANYEDVYYQVTVHGGTADRETAILGTVVEITANPAGDGKRFTGWTVNSGGAVLDDETADITTFQMPAHDVEVTANYEDIPEPDPYHIAVFRTGWQSEYLLGDTVALAARAEGGVKPYHYQYYTLGPDDTKTILSTYRYSNIFNWTPATTGDYRIGVEVKDAEGQIRNQVKEVSIRGIPLKVAVFRAGWQTEYLLGNKVALAARAKGGVAPYRYQYYAVGSDNVERILSDYAYSNIYSWQPQVADTWQVGVRIKDATGEIVSQVKNVIVRAFPPLKIAVFRAGYKDQYDSGQVVALAARAEGGAVPYRYQFYVVDSAGNKTVLRDYAYSNIFSWTPGHDDDYEVHVSVKDGDGTVIDVQRNISVGSAE